MCAYEKDIFPIMNYDVKFKFKSVKESKRKFLSFKFLAYIVKKFYQFFST